MVEEMAIVVEAEVTVVFSPAPGCEEHIRVKLTPGASLLALIGASGLPTRYPAFDFAQAQVGIWGKLASRDALVRAHDRIEIYRPLLVDPKIARARRANRKNKSKRAETSSTPAA